MDKSGVLGAKLKEQKEVQNQSKKQVRQYVQHSRISSRNTSNNNNRNTSNNSNMNRKKNNGHDDDDHLQLEEIDRFVENNQWVNINRYPGLNNQKYHL